MQVCKDAWLCAAVGSVGTRHLSNGNEPSSLFLHTTERSLWKAKMVNTRLCTEGAQFTQEQVGEGEKGEERGIQDR